MAWFQVAVKGMKPPMQATSCLIALPQSVPHLQGGAKCGSGQRDKRNPKFGSRRNSSNNFKRIDTFASAQLFTLANIATCTSLQDGVGEESAGEGAEGVAQGTQCARMLLRRGGPRQGV
jgi:hypothetical protein